MHRDPLLWVKSLSLFHNCCFHGKGVGLHYTVLKNTPIENKELMRQSPHKKDEKPKTSAEVGLGTQSPMAAWRNIRFTTGLAPVD
jgi:hypothetical protein